MTTANTKPTFVHHPVTAMTAIPATANTNRDGTGTITAIYTADTAVNGSLIEVIKFIATGNTANAIVNLYRSIDAGSTWKFIGQVQGSTASVTVGTTTKADEFYYTGLDMPMRLNASDKLGAAPTVAQAYTAIVQGGPLANSDS